MGLNEIIPAIALIAVLILVLPTFLRTNIQKKIYELPFGSKIKVTDRKSNFLKFSKGWIKKKDVKPINHREKNLFRKVLIFKNVKYKWGGKRFDGVDCSGLIQLFYKFNNLYCLRDTGPQLKYFKKSRSIKKIVIIKK